MLHKKEKELLRRVYEAPKPVGKNAFLQQFSENNMNPKLVTQEVSMGYLILSQATYVRKWVWFVSILALFGAVVLMRVLPNSYVWLLSAVGACASVTLVAELAKSVSYGMSELEASTRFSLKLILLARMSAVGVVHILVLLLAIPFMGDGSGMEIWRKAMYIVVPYFLTAGLGAGAVRASGKRDSMMLCVAIGVGVGVLFPAIQIFLPIYSAQCAMYWTASAFILMLWFIKQTKLTMGETENLV